MELNIAQSLVDQAFTGPIDQDPLNTQGQVLQPQQGLQPEKLFSEQFFGVSDPSQILEDLGPASGDGTRRKYRFQGDGKTYSMKADKTPEEVLEAIWDHNSPGLWGAAKAQTLYGLPADMSSAIAYGLGGLNLDESAASWKSYSDKLRADYEKRYGQFMVPGAQAAWDKGKLWDYALQTLGYGAPYMGLALAGGVGGGLAAAGLGASEGSAAAALGSFLGSTAITSPVFVSQFADRQVAEMRAKGIENPEEHIDWAKAAGFGSLAAGLQAIPVESILLGNGLLGTLTKWGVKPGTPTSARMLASIADIAGTNALATTGASFLSRTNADMPLLDDGAKSEYLDAAIMGSLVGIPFGIYKGFRAPTPRTENAPPKPLKEIIEENREVPEGPVVIPGEKGPEAKLEPPAKHAIIFDPNETYGIANADAGSEYLNSINYKTSDGTTRNGLDDFVRKHGISYSDVELVDAARRVKRARELKERTLRTPNGIVYKTVEDLPQVHSNDPKILTKAAALADRYGYDDAHVRSMPDTLIEKLHDLNLRKELSKLTTQQVSKETLDALLVQQKNLVDEQVMKDVQQYGSIYQRPQSLERANKSIAERRETLSKNPRKELAKILMKPKDVQRSPDEIIRQPDLTKAPRQARDVEGQFYDQFVGAPREAIGPRALLEYKPFDQFDVSKVVEALDKGANRQGPRISDKLTKEQYVDFLMNSPLVKAMVGENASLKDIKDVIARGRLAQRKDIKAQEKALEPKVLPDGTFARSKPEKPFKYVEPALTKDAENHLASIRDALEKIAQERNVKLLKDNPKLGPALNDMAKRFAELSADTRITKDAKGEPKFTTKSIKGTTGILDSLARRAKLGKILENAFIYLGPKVGQKYASILDKMIAGQEVSTKDMGNTLTMLDAAFSFGNKEEFKNINALALQNLYKDLRNQLPQKSINSLEKSRDYLEKWYKASHGINNKDLTGFKTEELEAAAFSDYIRDVFNPNYKQFKQSKQSKVFNIFENALKRIQKEYGDQGYNKIQDIFAFNKESNENVPPEARRPQVFTRRIVDEISNEQAKDLDKDQAQRVQDAADDHNMSTPPGGFHKPPNASKGPTEPPLIGPMANNIGGAQWWLMSTLGSNPFLARHVPAFAKIYNIKLDEQNRAAEYDSRMTNKFSKMHDEHSWSGMSEAHGILAHLRMTDQRIVKDNQGRLVFNHEGKQEVLNVPMTKTVEDIADFYKEALRIGDEVYRKYLDGYGDEKLDPSSSLKNIKRVIDGFDEKITGNPIPELRSSYAAKKAALEQVYAKLQDFDEHIRTDTPYVPFMRFGDYVVEVVDRKTGDQVYFKDINTHNMFGSKARLPKPKEALAAIEKLGLNKRFSNKDKYEIKHYQMTYDNAGKFINRGLVSTELIQGLLASGMNSTMKTADHLATGVEDPIQLFKDLRSQVAGSKDRVLRYIAAKGLGRFSIKSKNIEGYSEDWGKVMDSYKNIWANSLAKQAKSREWSEAQANLQLEQNIPQHVRDKINGYIDYMNNPGNDFAGMRAFNFVWAMGLRPSSALLQIATIPQQVFASGLEYAPGNAIGNVGRLAKSFSKASNYVLRGKGYTEEKQHIIDSQPGFFRASIKHDSMADKGFGYSVGNNMQKAINKGTQIAGFMISPAERISRLSAFDFFHDLFKEYPIALRNALKQREKDYNWQEFWNNHKDRFDLETAMSLYTMQENHAVFGKVGRGPLQRGLAGSLFFPFMTYAQQVMEVMGEQLTMQRGLPGLYAGLWTMGSYLALAGAAGIPGYDLWKTMYEEYQKRVNNKLVDAEMQMRESGIPLWARKGLLSTSTGLDLSMRLGQDIIAQQLLSGMIKGEFKLNEIGGVPGRTAVNVLNAAAEALNPASGKSPMQMIAPIMPSAVQDVMKAYQLASGSPEDVLQTTAGKSLRDPSDVSNFDIAAKLTGFNTLKMAEERQQLFWQQKANQEFNAWKSRLSESVAQARYKMALGQRQGDPEKVAEGKELLDKMRKELTRFAKENKISLDNHFWRGFNRNVSERLWQKLNPGKIRKPTDQEKRHMQSLVEDETENSGE